VGGYYPDHASRKGCVKSTEDSDRLEVLELTDLIRRVVRARVGDPEVAQDVVQETLARVLEARPRIDDEGLAAYAVVTARNLVHALGREQDRSRRHAHRLLDLRTPADPADEVLMKEDSEAVIEALRRLSDREHSAMVGHEIGGKDMATLARELGSSPGGVAVQLARARAKLRVDYLVALRKMQPPTTRCRPVLMSLSAGDRRRQGALNAPEHLLGCDYCAAMSRPLMDRRRPLAALWPLIPVHRLIGWVRERFHNGPAQAAAGVGVVVAVAVVAGLGIAAVNDDGGTTQRPPSSVEKISDVGKLRTDQGRVRVLGSALASHVGEEVTGRAIVVRSVPADEGFWIGNRRGDRVWVRLLRTGESGFKVRAGDTVGFTGKVVEHAPTFARDSGVGDAEGAAELARNRQHIEVEASQIRID
jgi:RNA polymerase sigma factor (sigma-70 family)